jgi:formylglycine-generating enzyme
MKKILILYTLLIPLSITAQTCEQILADAQNAAKKGLYKDAVLKYLAAQKVCPTTRDQEIKGYIVDVFTKIDALKSKAEKAEKDVKDALKQAEVNLQKAKDEEAKALAEQAKAEKAEKDVKDALKQAEVNLQKAKSEEAKALAEKAKAEKAEMVAKEALKQAETILQQALAANERVVVAYLRNIEQHILKLEYDKAFEKCQAAVALNVENKKNDIAQYILEIAYFYTETDAFQAAINTLKLLNINALSNRTELLAAIQKNAPPQYFTFLEDRYYPKMIDVVGGNFTMRDVSDILIHEVRVNSFKMAETETTVWQYFLYLRAKRQKPQDTPAWQYEGNNPMVNMTWYDAVEYCNWVSERQNWERAYTIVAGNTIANGQAKGYRLPTEAEWEYAARDGQYQGPYKYYRYYSGNGDIDSVAWYNSNSSSRTQPVKRLKANALGLYDMSGNVWEWCFDWHSEKYNISSNKQWIGPRSGARRVVRGGSWGGSSTYCDVTHRNWYPPDYHVNDCGFRCVRYN